MSRLLLAQAHAALAAAIAVKAHVPGDQPEDHEDNTFGLPDGLPLRKKLRGFFREQLEQIAGVIPKLGQPLDDPLPRFSRWDEPMAAVMTPIVGVYWDRAGKSLRSRIGLDPKEWRVTDPNVHRAIQDQSIRFCRATNRTTDLGIAEAREAVRDQIARGLIGRGESVEALTKRVKQIFTRASTSRAQLIARTEASRAIHQASIASARASGVVGVKRWLLSAHSCPLCVAIASKYPDGIPLEGVFGQRGNDTDYGTIRYPPLHPNCRCTLIFDLLEEPDESEPEKEKEREKEKQDDRPADHDPDRQPRVSGSGGRNPGLPGRLPGGAARIGRRVAAFAAVAGSAPAARLTIRQARRIHRRVIARRNERIIGGSGLQPANPFGGEILRQVAEPIPKGPIADRIKAYMETAGKAKLEKLANLDASYGTDLAAIEKARTDALKSLDQLRRRKGYTADETVAVDAKVQELTDRRDAYKDSLRRNAVRVAEAIAVPAGERAVITTRMVTKGRAVPLVSREAEGWLGQVLAADPDSPKGINVEYGALKKASDRAYYSDRNRRINLSGGEPAATIVHEFGHGIEHQWPNVGELASEFLDHRVGSEKLRKLKDIFPKRKFEDWERGRKDKFGEAFDDDSADAWYCGKEYRHVARKPETRYATEILAMGLEKLMKDPVKFARKDPEFCAFVLGVLDGSIR